MPLRITRIHSCTPECGRCFMSNRIELFPIHIVSALTDDNYLSPLLDKDKIILPKNFDIIVDFPFRDYFRFAHNSANDEGTTVIEIVRAVCKIYKKIYKVEQSSSSIPDEGVGEFNVRNTTDGVFSIWGYRLDELYLDQLHYDEQRREVFLTIGV